MLDKWLRHRLGLSADGREGVEMGLRRLVGTLI